MGSTRLPYFVLICPWVVRLMAKLGCGIRERGAGKWDALRIRAFRSPNPVFLSDDCLIISVFG